MNLLLEYDLNILEDRGIKRLVGIDEAGRGCLAGPVVIAAVELDYCRIPDGLNDSKQLSAAKRERLYLEIIDSAIQYKIVEVDNLVIDDINIRGASLRGFVLAYQGLQSEPELAIIDGRDVPNQLLFKAESVVKGDTISACIAAASILAKVHRDALMRSLDIQYPGYGLAKHKGYGTVEHYAALSRLGATDIHRKSFRLGI